MGIRASQLREREDYQQLILEYLQETNGYQIRKNTDFQPKLAMDTAVLMEFLRNTQTDQLEKLERLYKDRTEETIINLLNNEILKDSRGLMDVLREGIEFDNGTTLTLLYRKPETSINKQAVTNYEQNIFSVMEEVYHKEGERIDLVLFVNGLAIFTVELKCNTSGQSYEDAIEQYKQQRDAKTRLFKPRAGVLAAFAMDLNEVYFTTELKGHSTFFNPFNIGDNYGKGNPHHPDGINVSYMWEDIWTKDTLSFLLERIIYIKTKESRNPDTKKVKRTKSLIFPRYHQLRAVRRVLADVKKNGPENNYLIEHSAGSGKTETISWLAHTLATVHNSENQNIFDTVLIVTDRIVVDRQLQEAIQGIPHKAGQVKVMDDKSHSADLASALRGNTKIIVTTIHKFFHILQQDLLGKIKHKTFAVVIDEAHSSTHGTLMQAMTTVLSHKYENSDGDDNLDVESSIIEEIQKSGKQPNVSMIAFTATPKPETIQLFGKLNADGHKESFDLYSMKQAIEEGYILNVLDNYVIYKTYFELQKKINDDPEFKSITAKRKIARFIDLHDTNIAQKVEIIIEHFKNNIMHQLDGTAKAMVVTSSREAAVKYRYEFERYIKANGYSGIRALVAFSGKVKLDQDEISEEGINQIKEDSLRYEFDRKEYQVLIVADKYQTGFDQPKLVAMYVDKKLRGVTAVQTLSRLNRIYPPYDKPTFILDFKNDYKDIQAAFEPYYKDTILFETISPSDIRELSKVIYGYNILDSDDIVAFNDFLYQDKRTNREKQKMWSLLDKAARELYRYEELRQKEMIATIKRYLKGYLFLIQSTFYENVDLHKLYNFLSYLIKEVHPGTSGNNFDIADKITVSHFRQKQKEIHQHSEIKAKPEVAVKKPQQVTLEEEQKKTLSAIIDELNNFYNKDYEMDSTTKAAMQIRDLLLNNPSIRKKLEKSARSNGINEFKYTYDDCMQEVLVEALDQNTDFFTLLLNTPEVRTKFADVFMQDVYHLLGDK